MPIRVTNQDALARPVLEMYEKAERAMMMNFSRRFAGMAAGRLSRAVMMAAGSSVSEEADRIVQELRALRIAATERAILNAYDSSMREAAEEIRQVQKIVKMPPGEDVQNRKADILEELTKRLDKSDNRLKRQYRKTYEDIVREVSGEAADGGRLTQAIEKALARLGDSGFQGFLDNTGRRWNHVSYAETAAVSALETAVIKGFMHMLETNNYDLVMIEGHYGGCPICTAWNGVVISISGATGGYPTFEDAVAAGCFHPRCSHHLRLYREGSGDEIRIKPRKIEKPVSLYSKKQEQRRLEAEIRRWKRRAVVSITPMGERTAYAHVRYYQNEIRKFLKENDGMRRIRWREGLIKR